MSKSLMEAGEIKPLQKRKLSIDTCKKFGYSIGKLGGKTVQIAPYFDEGGDLVGQHIRFANKDFIWKGEAKKTVLFGQHLWRDGGKMLIITEGEIDAMSLSQIQGNRWPVVSIQTGAPAATKAIKKSLEWIESFEAVVFAFDMDEPGQKAAKECAALLSPGKAKIAYLPYKDANECLVKGKSKELMDAVWQAKEFRPDGIIDVDDIIEDVLADVDWGLAWPWDELTQLTYGRRRGEVYTFGAGTGIGKTDVFTQIISYTIFEQKLPVGVIYLEQKPSETVKRIAGKRAGKRFHVPDTGWNKSDLKKVVDELCAPPKLLKLYNHFGSTDWEIIRSRIRYMAVAHGVKDIFLDHLTALAAHAEDERKALEELMAEIASLAQELDITIYLISHLATPDGTPHEEGGRVMIRHFKGSRAIGYWSHFMFGLERNQQEEDENLRKITTFRILKDRYTGTATGKKIYLKYEEETGLLHLTGEPTECDQHFPNNDNDDEPENPDF